ncbi:MAG: hypothetical protein AB1384_12420 [Actinomycetota bacterium]
MKVKVLRPCSRVVIAGKEYRVKEMVIEVPESVGADAIRRFPDHYAPYEKEQDEHDFVLEEIKEVK